GGRKRRKEGQDLRALAFLEAAELADDFQRIFRLAATDRCRVAEAGPAESGSERPAPSGRKHLLLPPGRGRGKDRLGGDKDHGGHSARLEQRGGIAKVV